MAVHYFRARFTRPPASICFSEGGLVSPEATLSPNHKRGLMLHHHPPSLASFLKTATMLWLSMLVGIVLFATIVSGFLWYLSDRAQADQNFVLIGQLAALTGAVAAKWFPKSKLLVRRFEVLREDSLLKAYQQALIVGMALAEFGALALLVAMLLSQVLIPAVFFIALPLWSMISLRPSHKAFEAFRQWHREQSHS
jgi:hypothetical protein